MPLKEDGVHFVLCPKQGNKIEGVVLNRVRILGFFCPKKSQGLNPHWLTYTQTLVDYPPPPGLIPAMQRSSCVGISSPVPKQWSITHSPWGHPSQTKEKLCGNKLTTKLDITFLSIPILTPELPSDWNPSLL